MKKKIKFTCTCEELSALVEDLGLTLRSVSGGHFTEDGQYIEPMFTDDGTEIPEGVNTFEFEDALQASREVLERHARAWRKDSSFNRLRSRQLQNCELTLFNFD